MRKDLKLVAAGDEQPVQAVTFDEFWSHYPKRRARKDALKAWGSVSLEDRQRILPALAIQKQSVDWRKDGGTYVPLPASWLRGERWDDEMDVALNLGQCVWNQYGDREPGGRCTKPATMEKFGMSYCATHGARNV